MISGSFGLVDRFLRLVLLGATLALLASGVSADSPSVVDTITVCASGCDYTTIQGAIDAPLTGDGDLISIVDPVHTEAGVSIHKSVLLAGAGVGETVVQANDEPYYSTDRVFVVSSGVTVTMRDMTIRYGRLTGTDPARGGGIYNEGALTLQRVMVTANSVIGITAEWGGMAEGGGIYNNGALTVTHSAIVNNGVRGGDATAEGGGEGRGGGIANGDGGTLVIIASLIDDNLARGGSSYG